MPRPLSGSIVEKDTKTKGRVFALRTTAYGRRYYTTLGYEGRGWDRERAEQFRDFVIDEIKAGRWKPPVAKRGSTRARPGSADRLRRHDASDLYAMIRKAAQTADRVLGSTPSSTVRMAMRDAMTALYDAEDVVGQAIRVG